MLPEQRNCYFFYKQVQISDCAGSLTQVETLTNLNPYTLQFYSELLQISENSHSLQNKSRRDYNMP